MTEQELKAFVGKELNEGVSLGEIQKKLASEFNYKMTFMDLRLLAGSLEEVDWTKQDPAPAEPKEEKVAPQPGPATGVTVVEKSAITRPGSVANGTVSFASGASAEWLLDEYGRLGLDNVVGEPTPEDIKAFQEELQKLFRG